jgi:hypothetical protein
LIYIVKSRPAKHAQYPYKNWLKPMLCHVFSKKHKISKPRSAPINTDLFYSLHSVSPS